MSRERVEYIKVKDDSDEKRSLLKSKRAGGSLVEPDSRNPAPASSIPMVSLESKSDLKESKDEVVDLEEKRSDIEEKERLLEMNQEEDQNPNVREDSCIGHVKRILRGIHKREWGLLLYLMLILTAALMRQFIKVESRLKLKRTMTLLTLISFFITYVWLNAYELLYGLGLFFLMNPAFSWTIKETSGMWIGNVGFGISFGLGLIAQGIRSSDSKTKKWLSFLWYSLAFAMAHIVYFPLHYEKYHYAAITLFVIVFITILLVEQSTSTIVVGWFQLSLCFILVGLLIMGVEGIFLAMKIKYCAPGLYRNQIYILFAFIFYLIGLVTREFRAHE